MHTICVQKLSHVQSDSKLILQILRVVTGHSNNNLLFRNVRAQVTHSKNQNSYQKANLALYYFKFVFQTRKFLEYSFFMQDRHFMNTYIHIFLNFRYDIEVF